MNDSRRRRAAVAVLSVLLFVVVIAAIEYRYRSIVRGQLYCSVVLGRAVTLQDTVRVVRFAGYCKPMTKLP